MGPRLRALVLGGAVTLSLVLGGLAGGALAQDRAQTLADIKAELAALMAEFVALKQELLATGAGVAPAGTGDALQRMDTIEAELTRLTAQTEDLELRLKALVADGTNRIGDLEFRLCEATEGCDPASLPETPVLGGADGAAPVAPAPGDGTATPAPAPGDLAMNEQADFDRAKAALDSGDFPGAAQLFAAFAETYTGGQLTQSAQVYRGDALDAMGDTSNSARAYLEAFSGQPTGPVAGLALTKLGQQLAKLGQKPEACLTLAEVGKRFPGTGDALQAESAMLALGCP